MKVQADVEVDSPVHDVWQFITNVENFEIWAPDGKNPRQTSPGEFGLGTTFALEYRFQRRDYDIKGKVTAFNPSNHMALENRGGPIPMEEYFDLEETPAGTQLRHTNDFHPEQGTWRILFAVLPFLMRPMMRAEMRKELRALKQHLEAD